MVSNDIPKVIFWQKAFCVLVALLYLLMLPLGIFLLEVSEGDLESQINGIVIICMGPPLAILYGLGFIWDHKPWHWIYGLVLICLSLSSCCCFPISIPLLIYWLKPETKAHFNPQAPPEKT